MFELGGLPFSIYTDLDTLDLLSFAYELIR